MIQNPAVLSAAVPQAVFHLERLTGVEVGHIDLKTAFKVIRVNARGPAITYLLFHRVSDEIQPAFVEVVAELVRPGHPDHDGRSVGHDLITLFALTQCLLRSLLSRNVPRHFRGSYDAPGRIPNGRNCD